MTTPSFTLGEAPLRVSRLAELARTAHTCVTFSAPTRQKIVSANHFLLAQQAAGAQVYGMTTGLGAAVDTPVNLQALALTPLEIQRRIPRGRAVGVGPLATPAQVRAMMLARLAGIAVGHSGMSLATAEALLALFNADVHPAVPLIGSLSEADLAPLAHIALVVIGEGVAEYNGESHPAGELLASLDLSVPELSGKDGLALVSSNAASVGLAALLLDDMARVFSAQTAAIALSFEGFVANLAPLSPLTARLRPAPGQGDVAALLSELLAGGTLSTPGKARRLQDPLSFRNIAVVLGCVQQALAGAFNATELELNSSDDNPAVLVEEQIILGNANFDATHLTLALEQLGLAISRLAAAGGERLMKLMSPGVSELPRFLVSGSAQSGFGPLQKTIAALVADVQQQAQPLAAVTLPVADRIEDYAAQTMAVVQKLQRLLESWRLLVAIELLVAAQAIDLRTGLTLGVGTQAIYQKVRQQVARLDEDRSSAADIRHLAALIEQEEWVPQSRLLLEKA
ncbi:histidine ammonia-lyase [Paramixta manurensis]|uniref:Histidine ammonia-lyase n=1 Tax=Paramixta manurensis TaxID=2740817 RepID=A0A6M8U6J1_9GAMM|nr:histidine ammonia-lyase [Erwiniaceae bacterium PD-1]